MSLSAYRQTIKEALASTWANTSLLHRQAFRTVLPMWAAFTALRWVVALAVGHFFTPTSTFAASGVRAAVSTWDASIFLAIADDGYVLAQTPFLAAFFPGFPLATRMLAWPLSPLEGVGDPVLMAGVILTSACSFAAALLIYEIACHRFSPSTARWAVILLMAWPSAAFLTALYSEGLYMVAAMGAWLLATRHRWLMAGLLCGAASFIRVTGVFLCAALLVMYLTTVLQRRVRFRWLDLGSVMLGGWGVVAFFVFLFVKTGDPLAWPHIEESVWDRHTVAPWTSLEATWAQMFSPTFSADWRWQMAADMAVVLICVPLVVLMALRRYWPELALTVLTLGSAISSTSYTSVTRYTLTAFPLMIVAGSLLARVHVATASLTVLASTAWMATVMGTFALGYWAG